MKNFLNTNMSNVEEAIELALKAMEKLENDVDSEDYRLSEAGELLFQATERISAYFENRE